MSSSLKKNPKDEPIRTLYVGGIYGRITEQDLRDHFSAYSEVESVKMVPKRACAFVTYTSRKGAEKAANELGDSLELKGLPLKLMWGRPPNENEERQQSVAHNDLLPQKQNQIIQPSAASREDQQPAPMPQPFSASMDLDRMAEGSTAVSASGPDEITSASVSGERVETQTMQSGGGKRSSDPLEGMSPQEMRERVMRRKKGSSTSTLPPASTRTPVVPPVTPLVSVGMAAAVGESSEETHPTRFVTSFPRDFLLQKSGVWPDADSLLFPGPMNLLEKKSDIDVVNDGIEMILQALQSMLMCRRQLRAQLGQPDVWCVKLAEAEAAEARMSSQLKDAEAENLSLKEAAAAAEARAVAAVEAQDARDTLLLNKYTQIRELKEKLRLQYEEIREQRKDAASPAGLRARAKVMREFLDNKSSSWDPQADIDYYVAHIREEADSVS